MSERAPSTRGAGKRSRIAEHEQAGLFLRWLVRTPVRVLRLALGFVSAYAALALVVYGVFRDAASSTTSQLLALAGLTALMMARLFDRLQRPAEIERRSRLADLELGTLFIAAAFVLIELTGGPEGLLYPLLFALVAFLVAFHGVWESAYFLALIITTEALVHVFQPATRDWRLLVSHASFTLLFGFLYSVFLRRDVAHRRSAMVREVEARMSAITSEAQEFRLTSGLGHESRDLAPDELARRRRIGSVQAIHESLYNVLAVAERALEPHTVALLWMDADDKRMRVKELRSASDHVNEAPLAAGEGLLGAITKRREPLVLSSLKPGHAGLVYYDRPEAVTDFAGVPVMEGQHLRGVLVADRTDGRAFDESDLAVMHTIAEEIVRAVQVERIFAEMDREKYRKERFYQASRDFNAARTVDEVAKVAIEASRRVTQAEFAAVAVATEEEGQMRIASLDWLDHPQAGEMLGKSFAAEEGLVGAALKSRHPLPAGTARATSQAVFSPALDVPLAGVKVLPLVWQDRGVGALVLGSAKDNFLSLDLFDMMRVVADHATIAIANAQMYERMERMATTDGLTGLTNHRTFQSLFEQALAKAERYGRRLSLVLTDIDHFKSVNDTYGHPVGDLVLKRVSKILGQAARRTDVVARYGGEEFAVLMEETDREGALIIAERIRKMVEAEVFRSEHGPFRCTLSLGIATFPDDATQKGKLAEAADQALYQAKRGGRNRSMQFKSMSAVRAVSP